jgi:hypothetical protein
VNGSRLFRDVRTFLGQERDVLLDSFCTMRGGVPDRSTMEPNDSPHVAAYDKLIARIDAHLEKSARKSISKARRRLGADRS